MSSLKTALHVNSMYKDHNALDALLASPYKEINVFHNVTQLKFQTVLLATKNMDVKSAIMDTLLLEVTVKMFVTQLIGDNSAQLVIKLVAFNVMIANLGLLLEETVFSFLETQNDRVFDTLK